MRFLGVFPSVFLVGLAATWTATTSFAQISAKEKSAADAFERSANQTKDFLLKFHDDPKSTMNAPLPKYTESGERVPDSYVSLGFQELSSDEIFNARDAVRSQLCGSHKGCKTDSYYSIQPWAAIGESSQVSSFLYKPAAVRTLLEMEKMGLQKVILEEAPWSDSFWPTQKGLVARRWLDQTFPNSTDWFVNYTYYQATPTWLVNPDVLSPAEKYDLLVGDNGFSLTQAMWESGKYSYDRRGRVPGWAGLCHGWAPAAFMTKNPERSVVLMSPSGQPIRFYPSDIKALASLAWGESAPPFKVVGSRCNERNPKEDAVGRVIDEACFDVNPGTWHIGIVNQLGVEKRSFVFDSTYDYQVWNYPIYAYQYHYFNPQTLATSQKLSSAIASISHYNIDKFKSYRSPQARYVVGVAMDVTYSIPTSPSVKPVKRPRFQTVKYVYDLELDESGQIIGGEWYSNFHPDFLWNPIPETRPISVGEKELGLDLRWNGQGTVPSEIQRAARVSSAKGQVVSSVIEALVELSQIPDSSDGLGEVP